MSGGAGADRTTFGVAQLWPACLRIAAWRRGHRDRPAFDVVDGRAGADATRRFAPADAIGPDAAPRLPTPTDVWDDEARCAFALLEPLLTRPRHGRPWVIGQLGQSLDGCIATHEGDARELSSPEVMRHLHRLRALSDAVIVGAGTAALDDPQLTTRLVDGDHPVRVLLDPGLRLPNTLRMLHDGVATTLIACDAAHTTQAIRRFGAERVLAVPRLLRANGEPDMHALVAALSVLDLRLLFVEGGGVTASRFIAQDCMDRLHLSIAPVLVGQGRPGLRLPQRAAMHDCPRPPGRAHRMGIDTMWDLQLRAAGSGAA